MSVFCLFTQSANYLMMNCMLTFTMKTLNTCSFDVIGKTHFFHVNYFFEQFISNIGNKWSRKWCCKLILLWYYDVSLLCNLMWKCRKQKLFTLFTVQIQTWVLKTAIFFSVLMINCFETWFSLHVVCQPFIKFNILSFLLPDMIFSS